jgi:undecaprenyl pyrophosphate phosphatase UppP
MNIFAITVSGVPKITVGHVFTAATSVFMFAMGVVAAIAIIIAAFLLVLNGSDPNSVKRAKNAILYSKISNACAADF